MRYRLLKTRSIDLAKVVFSVMLLGLLSIRCVAQDQLAEEYTKLEETRELFQKALKEKRYQDISAYMTSNAEAVGPGTKAWRAMREEAKSRGIFPYDSIRMYPKETVIVSDTVAYDYGVSKVYYSNAKGELIELQDTFLVILKKGKDGKWRLHREVASGQVK